MCLKKTARRFKHITQNFKNNFSVLLKNLDTDFKIKQIEDLKELDNYIYRNKQNFSHFITKKLKLFKIIDIVIIGKYSKNSSRDFKHKNVHLLLFRN